MCESANGITVEKTLHVENAFVGSLAYMSLRKPVLAETLVLSGNRKGEVIRRISQDNGRTWVEAGSAKWEEKRGDRIARRSHPHYYLDPDQGALIEFVTEYEERLGEHMSFGTDGPSDYLEFRTGRIFYRFSRDEGKTWGPRKQLIQKGAAYDKVHWAEGIYYEKNSGNSGELLRAIKLKDGAIIVPLWFWRLDENGKMIKWPDRFGDVIWPVSAAACFRGRWRDDLSDIDWEMSNHVIVPEYMSRGLDEQAITELDDGNLMMLMRAGAEAWQTMPSVKFFSISKDGGRTWGPAVPLTYPDGSFVYSPSSLVNLFRSSRNGRLYLIANILPGPTRQCDPRSPLQIAEIDQKYFWVLPETVTVIEDREDRHPRFVRFSNWQRIEDRETGNPVIYITAARIDAIIPDTEGTILPHSYRYEIKLPD